MRPSVSDDQPGPERRAHDWFCSQRQPGRLDHLREIDTSAAATTGALRSATPLPKPMMPTCARVVQEGADVLALVMSPVTPTLLPMARDRWPVGRLTVTMPG